MSKFTLFFSFVSLFFGVSHIAYADDFDGTFVCRVVMNSDGSSYEAVIKITGRTLKSKRLGDDDSWLSNYILVHDGTTNPFKTFVRTGNTIQEDIIVMRKTKDKNIFHYNAIMTSDDLEVKSRFRYAICQKI